MREHVLKLAPFQTLDVLSCHVRKQLNDHARFEFSGLIRAEDEEKYLNTGMEEIQVKLLLECEGEPDYLLCCGIAQDIRIQKVGDLRKLTVQAVSGSYLMDLVRNVRVFQNSGSTYDAVLKHNEKS